MDTFDSAELHNAKNFSESSVMLSWLNKGQINILNPFGPLQPAVVGTTLRHLYRISQKSTHADAGATNFCSKPI